MLKTSVAGIPLESCIFNASGPRTASVESLCKIAERRVGAVVSKSCTLKKQTGNALPRFISKIDLGPSREGSLNSEGLPNAGVDYYIDPETIKEIGAFGKPYIVSLSGLNLEDNMVMLGRTLASKGVSAIELNLACPNIPGKPVIAYDFDQIEQVLDRLTSHPLFGQKPLGIKLAPYFDKSHVQRVVSILCKYPGIKFITCVNSMGNALFVDADKECECIAPGFGGLGGSYVKQTALANVRMFTCELQAQGRAEVDVVGVGGVFTGRDAFELILCGATAVQVGTCHWTEGPNCFDRITMELEELMREKGYSSISDFRGKLQVTVT